MKGQNARWPLRLAIALGFVVGFVAAAPAAAPNGSFSIRGIGAERCKTLVSAFTPEGRNEAIAAGFPHWVAGYLTRANRSTRNVFEAIPVADLRSVSQMTLNVCRAHPDSLVEAALAGLIRIFAPSAQKAETPFVEVRNGEHSTHVRQDVLRQTQEALIKEQLLPAGSADGAYGPRTRQALSAYQTKQGLPATGIPDPATLVKILVPKG